MTRAPGKPSSGLSRRSVLGAMGLAAACPFAGMAGPAGAAEAHRHVTDAPGFSMASPEDVVPCLGRHQAGIVTPRPANGMIASFAVIAATPDELEDLLVRLTARIAFLTAGGPVPDLDPRLPAADSGILGPVVMPDALTVTVSLGASLFEDRPWLAALKPRRLTRMKRFSNDALDAGLCHGDLTLQICANTQDTTIHALRDILKTLPGRLILRWKQEGNVPVVLPGPGGTTPSARNFLGFRDGSANPDASDTALMERLVWVGPGRDEPDWAQGGSYQAVRIVRNFVERWDRTPLGEQERIMGRVRATGAPLDNRSASEFDAPDYAADPEGALTALDSHIRLANPRNPGSTRILRRPFNYSNGVTKSGQLDQGLLFICYQSDLERGFVATQRRLDGEPLEEYIKPVGGGYFFTLPGIADASDHLGSALIAAARSAA
jgi:deferrochelatase/peroxidase EfeB